MNLVIVESPAKAKTINKYLGSKFKVIASYGHIRDLPSKEGSVLPDEDFKMKYEISSGSTKQVKVIVDEAKKADKIILATDPDREGEAISWHILEMLQAKKAIGKDTQVERVAFNAITKGEVLKALEDPRDLDINLINAQQARRALDYLVGFNLSPVLWRKLPGSRSAGRVQSVALRMICDREDEIEKFKAQEYWDITLDVKTAANKAFQARVTHINDKKLDKFDIPNQKSADEIVAKIEGQDLSITNIERKEQKRNPTPPFTTSTMQQEAARKLGFSAKRTMQVAQRLYEGIDIGGETVGLITYMRTDGVYVAGEAINYARKYIGKEFGDKYLPEKPRAYSSKQKNAQEAHEAIRPTDVFKSPKDMAKHLDNDQARLYELIWNRLIASQMQSVVLDLTVYELKTKDGYATARANGSVIKFDGFYKLYHEDKDDSKEDDSKDKLLPAAKEGENINCDAVKPAQHFTEPPPRFSEASLVKELEKKGIGRPSTYASIISVLLDRDYVIIDKKRFYPEDRGRIVTIFLENFFKQYVQYDFTAQLEEELDTVSEGKLEWKKLLTNFWGDFHSKVEQAQELRIQEVIDRLNEELSIHFFPESEDGKDPKSCPKCDKGTLGIKLSRYGAFIGCSDYPECNFTRKLKAAASDGEDENELDGPKVLGKDDASGDDISLRKGPYGFYLQLGEAKGKEKPKRFPVPKGYDPHALDLDMAKSLITLPREVGKHPESGEVIKAGIGRYGPYLIHEGKFTSLKEDDVLTIGINRAVDVLATAKAGGGGKKSGVDRELGKHPKSGDKIDIFVGRYGKYIKYGKKNVRIPKGSEADKLTLEDAIKIIDG